MPAIFVSCSNSSAVKTDFSSVRMCVGASHQQAKKVDLEHAG